jgi:hypothetical protein
VGRRKKKQKGEPQKDGNANDQVKTRKKIIKPKASAMAEGGGDIL